MDNYRYCSDPYGLQIFDVVPEPVKKVLTNCRCYLAGGFIRSFFDHTIPVKKLKKAGELTSHKVCELLAEKDIDLDIFCKDKDQAMEVAQELGLESIKVTENSVYGRLYPTGIMVQCIYRWGAPSAEEVIGGFDFVCCQAVILNRNGHFHMIYHKAFRDNTYRKILSYTQPVRDEEPAGSLVRALKYVGRGYKLPGAELAKLVFRALYGQEPNPDKQELIKQVTKSIQKVSKNGYC